MGRPARFILTLDLFIYLFRHTVCQAVIHFYLFIYLEFLIRILKPLTAYKISN